MIGGRVFLDPLHVAGQARKDKLFEGESLSSTLPAQRRARMEPRGMIL
jgi:hypothetical protein